MSGRSLSKNKAPVELMNQFASRTGISTSNKTLQKPDGSKRYLWTDAFAVCNYVGFARAAADSKEKLRNQDLALTLVNSVHQNLGRLRKDDRDPDRRLRWISGLDNNAGANNPTLGGLRIGKENPERGPDEPHDERAEWHQDGQYFHYLTKWMLALTQLARYTGDDKYLEWAIQLASKAADSFVYPTGRGGYRMYWKMSTDLSRPLVLSMGAQDPLDGYVAAAVLSSTATKLSTETDVDLDALMNRFKSMMKISPTSDSLGIGGMLVDAYRVFELLRVGATVDFHVLADLLENSLIGLSFFSTSGELRGPAVYRLAFRELGLSVGLHAMERMKQDLDEDPTMFPPSAISRIIPLLEKLVSFAPMAEEIETFWLDAGNQKARTWIEHIDINEVMLATSLAPDGFLSEAYGS